MLEVSTCSESLLQKKKTKTEDHPEQFLLLHHSYSPSNRVPSASQTTQSAKTMSGLLQMPPKTLTLVRMVFAIWVYPSDVLCKLPLVEVRLQKIYLGFLLIMPEMCYVHH